MKPDCQLSYPRLSPNNPEAFAGGLGFQTGISCAPSQIFLFVWRAFIHSLSNPAGIHWGPDTVLRTPLREEAGERKSHFSAWITGNRRLNRRYLGGGRGGGGIQRKSGLFWVSGMESILSLSWMRKDGIQSKGRVRALRDVLFWCLHTQPSVHHAL